MTAFIIILLLIIAWDFFWYMAGVKPLFPWQLKKMLEKGQNPGRLIDVRTQLEFNWYHTDGAVNRPDILLDVDRYKVDSPNKPLIIICMTGHRSPIAAYRLKKHGYKQVYNLTWGMLGWKLTGGNTK